MGDGSASRTLKRPATLVARAEAFDALATAALGSADLAALDALDATLTAAEPGPLAGAPRRRTRSAAPPARARGPENGGGREPGGTLVGRTGLAGVAGASVPVAVPVVVSVAESVAAPSGPFASAASFAPEPADGVSACAPALDAPR
ncbi:hypothetical protein SGLAM104S_02406 [Streptomyces glaucescens]